MRKVFVSFLIVGLGFIPALAADFPIKPIEMIIPFGPGGGTDSMGRPIAKGIEKDLGQPVIVINKPGGGSVLGVTAVKNAKRDGYTIGVGTSIALTYTPLVEKVQYSIADYRFLGSVAKYQECFVTTSDKPYKNFKELVAYAKKNPGMSFGYLDAMAETIIKAIAKKEGLDLRIIPHKGGSELMAALMGKHVDFAFSGLPHVPFVRAGEMVVLAALSKQRLLGSPEAPTLIELGYDLSSENFLTFFAPKGIPEDAANRLTAAIEKAAKDPKYVDFLKTSFQVPATYLSGDQLAENLMEAVKTNQRLLKASK